MNKINATIIFLAILSFNSLAQKVDLDKYTFVTHHVSLPDQYIEKDKRTYNVKVKSSSDFGTNTENKLHERVKVPSFTLQETDPTVSVIVNLDRFKFIKSEIKERYVDEKSKEGKVTRTYYYKIAAFWDVSGAYDIYGPYKKSNKEIAREEEEMKKAGEKAKEKTESLKANAFLKSSTLVETKEDQTIKIKEKPMYRGTLSSPSISGSSGYSSSFGGLSSPNYETQEYGSSRAANDAFTKEFNAISERILNLTIENAINKINNQLYGNYGIYPTRANDHLWILDSKKHPEYEMQKQALDAAKLLFDSIKAEESVLQIAKDFQPLIDYFNELPGKYKQDEKADKKIRYGTYYNLSKIYYYLDMPDNAIMEAEKLIKNDYDSKDGENLKEQAQDLKNRMANQKVNSQHFSTK